MTGNGSGSKMATSENEEPVISGEESGGCIILGNTTEFQTRNVVTAQRYRWIRQFNVQPSPSFNDNEIELIKKAMLGLQEALPCLKFQVFPANSTLRGDHIRIWKGKVCSSYVGRQGFGAQPIYLTSPGCMAVGLIQHELLHALGFHHEHNRPDRDNFITIQWDNIRPGLRTQFYKSSASVVANYGVPYNVGSVMHYSSRAFSVDGSHPTITQKNGDLIPIPAGLQETDRIKLRPTTVRSLSPQNVIRIEYQLDLFKDCSIHVAINHLNIPSPTRQEGSYMIEPFKEHPIILSLHRFKKSNQDKASHRNSDYMLCDGDWVQYLPHQQFKFRAPPSPKSTCFVQLYIDPAPCKKWVYRSGMYFQSDSKPFTRMYLDPGFDYRSEDKTWESLSGYNFAKSGLFFIHVMQPRNFPFYATEVLFKVDYGWQLAVPFFAFNFIQPTKFVFQIEKIDVDTPYTPEQGGLLSCQNYDEWWQRLEKDCENPSDNSHEYRVRCLSTTVEYSAEFPGLLPHGGDNTKSWRELEDIVGKSKECRGHNMWLGSPSKKLNRKMDNLKIGDLKLNDKHEEDVDAMERVIISLLFPNATMYGSELASSFYTAQTFPFLSVVKTTTMFTESAGYVGKFSTVKFITCAPVAEGNWLSLAGLVAAFQGPLWLTLGIAAVVSGMAMHFMLRLSQLIKMERGGIPVFYALVFVWDVLLGQGSNAVDKIKWIGGSWALIGIVVTNAYLGDNINMLTAPLPVKRVETFDELFSNNFTIHSTIPFSSEMRMIGAFYQSGGPEMQLLFAITAARSGGLIGESPETLFTKLYITAHPNVSYSKARVSANKVEKHRRKIFKTAKDMASTNDMTHYLRILGKGGKDAFVEAKDTLDRTKVRLKTRLSAEPKLIEQLTMSKDSYGELIENWKFANIPWPATNFLIRTHGLLESGLIPLWKEWIHWIGMVEDQIMAAKSTEDGYRAVSLNGNIRSLFFLYLALSIVPFIFFVFGFKEGPLQIMCVRVHLS
ncbi:unnamed protein product [Orchesella dallaii]|uniref:Metalloendopeptidase n=1 Tax=Orchesella dallaii TaxID=48710 RepID=A0ABP1PZP3_9HEXA